MDKEHVEMSRTHGGTKCGESGTLKDLNPGMDVRVNAAERMERGACASCPGTAIITMTCWENRPCST